MARTSHQKIAGALLAAEETELYKAIGEFMFWFSQLEFSIKARLAGALKLEDGFFDIIIGPYDFAVLCTVTERALSKDAPDEVKKRVKAYFNKCRGLNSSTRLVVAHGSWTVGGGARHVERTSLEAKFHFEKPSELRKQAQVAKTLMRELFQLGATHR